MRTQRPPATSQRRIVWSWPALASVWPPGSNFYFSDISTAQAHKHVMTIEADTGNVGIGPTDPADRLHVRGGKLRLDGNQQVVFSDGDTTSNLKLQLWSGFGLGINDSTLFYAANGRHSWRDNGGANERMTLSTAADGGLTVRGTGTSVFSGPLQLRREVDRVRRGPSPFLELYQDETSPRGPDVAFPGIRFRHHNHFETTLEAQPDGFHLFAGERGNGQYGDLWSSRLHSRGLSIGSHGGGSLRVGTETPRAIVDIQDAARGGSHPTSVRGLYVTADLGEASNGIEFRHSNATQGIGFGHNSLYAAGTNPNQHLNLMPKGTGGVGIGTTTPGAKLDVRAAATTTSGWLEAIRLSRSEHSAITHPGGNLLFGMHGDRKFYFADTKDGVTKHRMVIRGDTGHVGIGTTSPTSDLQIGDFDAQDRYLTFKVAGGNAHRSGIKLWAWQENFGYSIEHDERTVVGKGLHVRTHDQDPDGETRVFLAQSGNVGIGTTSPQAPLHVNGDIRARDIYATGRFYFEPVSNWGTEPEYGPSRRYWYFRRDNWNVNNLAAGHVSVHASGVAYPSDARLKEHVDAIPGALDRVGRLRGVRFDWNAEGLRHLTRDIEASTTVGPDATAEENEQLWQELREQRYERLADGNIGLLAQDVEQVAPELVFTDDAGYKCVDYSRLSAVLVEAVKEQQSLIRDLTTRIATIERGA